MTGKTCPGRGKGGLRRGARRRAAEARRLAEPFDRTGFFAPAELWANLRNASPAPAQARRQRAMAARSLRACAALASLRSPRFFCLPPRSTPRHRSPASLLPPSGQPLSFPRRVCARGLQFFPPDEGWAERRQAPECSGTRLARRVTQETNASCERSCVT